MKISTKRVEIELARKRWTMSKLAEESGMTRQSLSSVLQRGSGLPASIGKIATALGVDVTEIMA